MPNYWCVNFDCDGVLDHGLKTGSWLTQYQFAHGGYELQHGKPSTTETWKLFSRVKIDDWVVAYLPHTSFYAVGQVCKPRKSGNQIDSVKRTLDEHSHFYARGVVRYRDAPAFYEDFSDRWNISSGYSGTKQPTAWKFAQRIDVYEWLYVYRPGIILPGMQTEKRSGSCRRVIVEISKRYFEDIQLNLALFIKNDW